MTSSAPKPVTLAPIPTVAHPLTPPRTPDPNKEKDKDGTPATDGAVQHGPPSPLASETNSCRSVTSSQSSQSRKEYLDSLVAPTQESFERIAKVQEEREAENKQKRQQQHNEKKIAQNLNRIVSDTFWADDASSHKKSPPVQHPNSLSSRLLLFHSQHYHHDISEVEEDDEDASGTRQKAAKRRIHHHGPKRANPGPYRHRNHVNGLGIDTSTRWTQALKEARWRAVMQPHPGSPISPPGSHSIASPMSLGSSGSGSIAGPPTVMQKWRKATILARRASESADADDEEGSSTGDLLSDSDAESDSEQYAAAGSGAQSKDKRKETTPTRRRRRSNKDGGMLFPAYYLELVDLKHRYGGNLRTYHEEWMRADTHENFFYWLDHGAGRFVDMASCPRAKLDSEQVRYLSREERQDYLVEVDSAGRLCWAKNGVRVDTSEKFRDSIHGIVPVDDPAPTFQPERPGDAAGAMADGYCGGAGGEDASLGDDEKEGLGAVSKADFEAARLAKYAALRAAQSGSWTGSNSNSKVHGRRRKIRRVSATTMFHKMLRNVVPDGTWIYVADTNARLYVGIKSRGGFQHSSFLQGSRISAAGSIEVEDGLLTVLSPISGHYRTSTESFCRLVRRLKGAGVDLSRLAITKSYGVVLGLELYTKTKEIVTGRKGNGLDDEEEEEESMSLLGSVSKKDDGKKKKRAKLMKVRKDKRV